MVIHQTLTSVYTVGQLEKGESGTRHLQFIVNLGLACRLTALTKKFPSVHWEPTKSKAAEDYCQKEDTRLDGPWTFGTKKLNRASASAWEEIREKAKAGNLNEIPADVYVRCYNTLNKIAEDHVDKGQTLP